MKRITTALFFFLTLAIQAKSQTQTIRADKYMIVPRSGLGSAYRTKFITDQVFARHRFYIGSDTSNYQNEAFDVTVNARFGAKIKLGTTYGNAGDYIRSGGSLVNPTWSKIQWTDIEGVPSSSNSWVKIPINGTPNLGIGNTSTSPFVFGSGTTRVGEYNQYGELYGFTTLSINSGYTSTKNYNTTGGGYNLAIGGRATFGYHTNMPDAGKVSPYYIDIAKRYSSDASQIRLATYNGTGQTNVPDWTIQSGANNVFSIQKAGSPWFTTDTTSSIYINAGRFNFGRSTGLNNTKFTFGGSMTVLGNFITDNIFAKEFSLIPTTGSILANQILTTDANGNGTWQDNKAVKNLSFSSGSFSWEENGFSFAAPPLVTLSTAQSITGVKTFQHNTSSYMTYFNNTNMSGKGVKFTNTGIFPAIEVWQDLGETPGVQLWSDGSGDFANYLRTKYFLMSNGAGANKILQSDVNGLGSWVANTSLPISTSTQTALDLKLNISTAITTYAPITQPTFVTDATTPRLKITGAGDIGNGGALVMAGNSNDLTMHGTGKVILGTGGFQRLVVTNAGNVGIGTTAPVAKFEVSGLAGFRYNDGKQADGKYLRSNSTGVSLWDSVRHTDVMGLSSNYLQLSGGNLTGKTNNIATENTAYSASTAFQNANNVGVVNQIYNNSNSTLSYAGIKFTTRSSLPTSWSILNVNAGLGLSDLIFGYGGSTASSERMRLNNSGHLGIGKIPQRALDVSGEISNDGNAYFATSTGNVGIGPINPIAKLSVSSAIGHVGFNVGTSSSPEKGNLYYDTDGSGWKFNIGKYQNSTFTSQMTFQDNGNVGIGTTSPQQKLHVTGFGMFDGGVVGNNGLVMYGDNSSAAGAFLSTAGNFGIGTQSPSEKLHVVGGNVITGGWTTVAKLEANFPVLLFNSLYGSKHAGIGYDATGNMMFWVNASSSDLITTGINALRMESSTGNATMKELTSDKYKLSALNTAPASATATGTVGEIRVTATHIYVCTATNTWVRASLATW